MQEIPRMDMNIEIGEERFDRNLNDDLVIDQNNLDQCLEQQAALYAYYAIRYQQVQTLRDQAEFDYDRIMNEANNVVREELTGSSAKVTEKTVSALVESRTEVLAAKRLFLKYASQRDQMYSLVRALEHKKDCVLAIAYKKRQEFELMQSSVIMKSKIPKSGIEE